MSNTGTFADTSLLWKVPITGAFVVALTSPFAVVPQHETVSQVFPIGISSMISQDVTAWTAGWVQNQSSVQADTSSVEMLRTYTGLTASQLARLFGVSRRSVNNWLVGGRMADKHKVRLSRLWDVMLALQASTPETRKSELLDASQGKSLFESLASQVSEERQIIHDYPLSARNQLGL